MDRISGSSSLFCLSCEFNQSGSKEMAHTKPRRLRCRDRSAGRDLHPPKCQHSFGKSCHLHDEQKDADYQLIRPYTYIHVYIRRFQAYHVLTTSFTP